MHPDPVQVLPLADIFDKEEPSVASVYTGFNQRKRSWEDPILTKGPKTVRATPVSSDAQVSISTRGSTDRQLILANLILDMWRGCQKSAKILNSELDLSQPLPRRLIDRVENLKVLLANFWQFFQGGNGVEAEMRNDAVEEIQLIINNHIAGINEDFSKLSGDDGQSLPQMMSLVDTMKKWECNISTIGNPAWYQEFQSRSLKRVRLTEDATADDVGEVQIPKRCSRKAGSG